MDWVQREFLGKETFNKVSYVASILWIMLAPLFLAPLAVDLESTPDFHCGATLSDKALHQKCFDQYREHYKQTGDRFLLRFFGPVNLIIILVVFVSYSQCIKSKIESVRKDLGTSDVERQQVNGRRNGIQLFCAYLGQLATRFFLRIVFIVLATLLFFKRDLNFDCKLSREGNNLLDLSANFTEINTYKCFISRGGTGFDLIVAFTVLNGVFFFVTLFEIVMILSRACFMKNANFLSEYLKPGAETQPLLREETDNPDLRQKLRSTSNFRWGNYGDKLPETFRNEVEQTAENWPFNELDFGFTNITDQGAKYLCDALRSENCSTLTELYLDGNRIGRDGAKDISDALKDANCKLTVLRLGEDVDNVGVEHLKSSLLSNNCKLSDLHISGSSIGNKAVSFISDALKDANCKLTKLYIHGNKIGDEGAGYLSKALESRDCKLVELTLIGNQIGNNGKTLIFEALQHEHCKLIKLWLEGNKIKPERHCNQEKLNLENGRCIEVTVMKCRTRHYRTPLSQK